MNLSLQIIPGIFSRKSIRKYTLGILTLFSWVAVINKADCQTEVFSTPGGPFNYTVPSYSGPFEPGDVIEKVELIVTIVGGGGGGGRGQGAGGGGGGQVQIITMEVNSGDVFPIFVGAGGPGGTATNGNGSNGMPSSFNGESAAGGFGGIGFNAGSGGNSSASFSGGSGSSNGARRAGGGGAGAGENGNNGFSSSAPPRAIGGNGGSGIAGFGGGGGGTAQGGTGVGNNILGLGFDGGTDGSTGNALNATSGGGGGGGGPRGGNGGDGLVIVDLTFSILPVEFLEVKSTFDAKNQLTRIEWSTAKEWESSHFEIQRSLGAVTDFKKIGEVMAMGWKDSVTEYEFVDKELPLFGGLLLYRIKQVDLNERYAYSDVMSIRRPEVKTTKGVWRAFPNPINNSQFRVSLLDRSQYEAEPISFRLVHANFPSKLITVASEAEMNEVLAQMIPQISKGVFVIEIRWGQKTEHLKILKL